jgi:hypothetical protein
MIDESLDKEQLSNPATWNFVPNCLAKIIHHAGRSAGEFLLLLLST